MPSEAHIRGARDPADPPAHPESHSLGTGPARAWGALDRERRLAAVAAGALFVTMLLPWYQQNAVVTAAKSQPLVSRNLDAFQVFSFVEAAVLLVAVAVLALLYLRAEGREFRLPGGDGAVVLAAGLWSALLLILRLFDKPGITQHGVAANVGIQWGIFFALAAAGVLAYAGSRMRAGQRPEPPLLRREPPPPRHDPPRRPPEQESTVVVRRTPSASRTPPLPPATPAARATRGSPAGPAPRATPAPAKPRSRYPPAPDEEQLSFEDAAPSADQ